MSRMPAQLDPTHPLPLYRQVEAHLEGLIRDGGLRPGDPLPSLSALVSTLGVNNLTVRRGIAELAQRGVLVTRQGRGTFVADGGRPCVLWVSGVDITRRDVSNYYLDLLRLGSAALRAHDLAVEPIWMAASDRDHPCLHDARLRTCAGVMLSACLPKHPILRAVAERGLPHCDLSMTSNPHEPGRVAPDLEQADRLARRAMTDRGCRRVTMMGVGPPPSWQDQVWDGMAVQYIESPGLISMRSQVERQGYRAALDLIVRGELGDGLYISDDVLACGAARALLQEQHAESVFTVVRCARQQVVPLGMPVSYITFDLQEQAEKAVTLLLRQIQREPAAAKDFHACGYTLMHWQAVQQLVLSA